MLKLTEQYRRDISLPDPVGLPRPSDHLVIAEHFRRFLFTACLQPASTPSNIKILRIIEVFILLSDIVITWAMQGHCVFT